jgi:pantoate--beta-alanine ligase
MILTSDLNELRATVAHWRAGGNLAFVPTMGNLHDGHLTLVREARRLADRVAVSIFVNPLQFGAEEDFDGYPRTFERDQELLEAEGVDLLFAPTVETIYPRPPAEQTRVEVPGISGLLCGASRPGHFVGVATVVCKLFNMVQPDIALFGEKDYQQLAVIRRMTEDLNIPVRIVGVATVRESDGLAMSSRNGYLTPEERARAPALYQALQQAAAAIRAGNRDFAAVEQRARGELEAAGLRPDYVSVRRAVDLAPAQADDAELVLLAAAFLGKARLIDNLEVRGTRDEGRAG